MPSDTERPRTLTGDGGQSDESAKARSRLAPVVLAIVLVALLGLLELQTSWLQSRLFYGWSRELSFSVEPGPAAHFVHPHSGPYDIRLGHSLLTDHLERLEEAGFEIQSQARVSPELVRAMESGLFPIYDEKSRAGLHISDRDGRPLRAVSYPGRVYPRFEAIPPVVVDTLLFIENREALDGERPFKNPAVEWDRFGRATLQLGASWLGASGNVSGGSTLATQIEKIRHSPGGLTSSVGEKARQMISASLRAYAGGMETADARRRIILDYLNSIPLAAAPGYGEVHGLGDGLWVWYETGFDDANNLLAAEAARDGLPLRRQAVVYRQALSLLLAIKKPTAFLVRNRRALDSRVDAYLRLMGKAGVIPERLRDAALAARPLIRERVESQARAFAERKATDGVRVELLRTLGVNSVYELDRLDLSVQSTLDAPLQRSVYQLLDRIRDPEFASRARLRQYRLLAAGDPAGVIYSVSLYEREQGRNSLRLQADNLNQPLNINEGTKLELGSTAKLRTLLSYLLAVAELHERLSPLAPKDRAALNVAPSDRLTRWAIAHLGRNPDTALSPMLEAAMERVYSASPRERFFTGGGMHRFTNFDYQDNTRVVSVREALRRSVNLAFIRLMRDLVAYHTFRLPGMTPELLTDPSHPGRSQYLTRFAEREGRQFLTRYYQKYEGLKPDEALHLISKDMRRTPRRLAAVYRAVRPKDSVNLFAAYLIGTTLNPNLKDELIEELYDEFTPGRYNLADRAYTAGVDPLELWLLQYKAVRPAASLGEVFRASQPYCQIAYNWLFLKKNRRAQDRAIHTILEVDAFREIHRQWKDAGYPFRWLVPSLATALGSSGDTPAALAELVGILANDGIQYPSVRVARVNLATDTPFETSVAYAPDPGRRVLPEEVARLVRDELIGVVEHGTAIRAKNSLRLSDGTAVPLGGKTGTGDNRYEMYGPGGRVIASRVINRTATFVFLIGDRYFGTVTAFVPGEAAGGYGFTSSLPVQIFRELAPAFAAVLEGSPPPDLVAGIAARPLPIPKPAAEPDEQATDSELPQTSPSTPPQTADTPST